MTSVRDIPVLIAQGRLDSLLDVIVDAAYERKKQIRFTEKTEMLAKLKPGDRVALKGLRPKYLNDMEGVVQKGPGSKPGNLPVMLDYAPSARYGRVIHIPANCLEKL